jgi:transposase
MKYATSLTPEIKKMLQEMWHNHPISRYRQRAHGILLSTRDYSIPQIAQILEVERKAVSSWIDQWENQGLFGLYDKSRSGRPPIFTEEEVALLPSLVDEEPRQLKQALIKIEKITGKQASCYTLKRVLKNSIMFGNVAAAH